MKTTFRILSLITIFFWLAIGMAACSLFTPAPAATPTNTPTATPTATPVNHDGLWEGGTISDASLAGGIRFFVQSNRITEMGFNYTLRTGGCTEITSLLERVDQFQITGNDFTARITDSYDKQQLTITGTFASATEVSGTLEFKGTATSCGDFDKKAKWTANTIPIPPTRTPTLTLTPTTTRPRPTTASTTPIAGTPETMATPVAWAILSSKRFSIMVPPGFYSQVPLSDVQLKPSSAQLILLGLDRETGFRVDVTESPALFHSAQKRMENRKSDFVNPRVPTTILIAQSGIKVNGKEAAVLEYLQNDLATVEYFIATEQEEFIITVSQAIPNDKDFVANAERIANSFTIDSAPTR